jgi:hypothetical protein
MPKASSRRSCSVHDDEVLVRVVRIEAAVLRSAAARTFQASAGVYGCKHLAPRIGDDETPGR